MQVWDEMEHKIKAFPVAEFKYNILWKYNGVSFHRRETLRKHWVNSLTLEPNDKISDWMSRGREENMLFSFESFKTSFMRRWS